MKTSSFCLRAPSQRTGKTSHRLQRPSVGVPQVLACFATGRRLNVSMPVRTGPSLGRSCMFPGPWLQDDSGMDLEHSSPTEHRETPRAFVLASRATLPARCSPSRAVAYRDREDGIEGSRSSCLGTAGDSVESLGLLEVIESDFRSCVSEFVNSSVGVARARSASAPLVAGVSSHGLSGPSAPCVAPALHARAIVSPRIQLFLVVSCLCRRFVATIPPEGEGSKAGFLVRPEICVLSQRWSQE